MIICVIEYKLKKYFLFQLFMLTSMQNVQKNIETHKFYEKILKKALHVAKTKLKINKNFTFLKPELCQIISSIIPEQDGAPWSKKTC
jgi:hypothetical protein